MKLIYKSDSHEIEIWQYDSAEIIEGKYRYKFIHGKDRVDGKIEYRFLTEDEVNIHLCNFRKNHLRMWHAEGNLHTIPRFICGIPIVRQIKTGKTNTGYENFYKQLIER